MDMPVTTPKKKVKSSEKISLSTPPEHTELINILLSQGNTIEDKYKILDARDKLIRVKTKKIFQLKHLATEGTCPDMCPEKERLMREVQHQVALYEQTDNGKSMDPCKAVKQYSRSSADQEAPLPHELRPVSVLQLTMCYLMHNIVDLCDKDEVNLAEWYHFLWDRTRGIRKDITQQELCSQGAVELVEQCARFHIHCSARLVAEEPSVFDQKINTENLTKCLQTLKYMYNDLRLKREECSNESEFRAYIILLNLNDANFMWEVQQLPEEIQKSKEIKFALEVYSALDKNNYVKFFKCVYATTYLNACILMRYFVQIRITAIKTLLKSYSPRALKTVFPLSELVKYLAFDDVESAVDFMQAHGVLFNMEKTHIIVERNSFMLPEFPYILDRSLNIVEAKRVYSVGKVICGRDLPPKIYENHIPQNSFDHKGYLTNKDILDESDLEEARKNILDDLEKERKHTDSIFSSQEHSNCPTGLTQKAVDTKNIFGDIFTIKESSTPEQKSTSIFNQPFIDENSSISNKELTRQPRDEANSNIISSTTSGSIFSTPFPSENKYSKHDSIFGKPVLEGITEIKKISSPLSLEPPNKGGFSFASPTETSPKTENLDITIEKKKQLEQSKEEVLAKKKMEDLKKKQQIERQKMEEQRMKAEKEKIELVKKKKRMADELKKRMEELKKEEILQAQAIKESVKEVLSKIVDKVEMHITNEKLHGIRQRMVHKRTMNIFKKWKNIAAKNKRKRKAVDCSSVWFPRKNLQESAKEFYSPSQDVTLALRKRYKYGYALDIGLIEDDKIEKINLLELTRVILKKRYFDITGKVQTSIFWKVLLSVPDDKELPRGMNKFEETVLTAFKWDDTNGISVAVEQTKPTPNETITYCIEKHEGIMNKGSDANGIIFIAKDFNLFLQQRIFTCLKNFGVFTKVPIVILLQEHDENICNLHTLIEEKILSDYVILVENLIPSSLIHLLEEGLIFLASKVEKPPPLELDTLSSFISKYLCTEIWKRANSFAKWNSYYKNCLRNPNIVISVFNEALFKLTKIITDKSCKEYARFPDIFREYLENEIPDFLPCNYYYFPEFSTDAEYIYKLENILKNLTLPKWQEQWPPNSEFELEVCMSKYCSNAFKEPEKPFYKVMSIILQGIDPSSNFEDIADILWTDIVEHLALEKLKQINFTLKGTEFDNKSIFNQYICIYNTNNLQNFTRSDWFYVHNPIIKRHLRVQGCNENLKIQASEKKISFDSVSDINKTIEEVTNQLQSKYYTSEVFKELDSFKTLLSDLESSINITKVISTRFEVELKNVLQEK